MSAAKTPSSFVRAASFVIALGLAAAPLPEVHAAAPAKAAAAPATTGKTVALLRFSGSPPPTADLRTSIQAGLGDKGWQVKSVALDLAAAGAKVKCKGDQGSVDCLGTIGKWLNSNPKTAADYIVHGGYTPGVQGTLGVRAKIAIFDIAKGAIVRSFEVNIGEQDLVAGVVVPQQVAVAFDEYLTAPAPATDDEKKILAGLDEPEKTAEEIAAEEKALSEAVAAAGRGAAEGQIIDTENIAVDLKADFKDFCRTGPRKKRKSREDPKDLRPACKRGPFWGYWQPRAWVALGLTVGAGLSTAAFYALALAARKPYKNAVSDLDGYLGTVDGDPRRDPRATTNAAGQRYDTFATEVSRTGAIVKRRALVGDILLGTTVVVAGVLAIIIFQDRTDAKNYIKQEKGLRAIAKTFRAGPMIGGGTTGAAFGFRF